MPKGVGGCHSDSPSLDHPTSLRLEESIDALEEKAMVLFPRGMVNPQTTDPIGLHTFRSPATWSVGFPNLDKMPSSSDQSLGKQNIGVGGGGFSNKYQPGFTIQMGV